MMVAALVTSGIVSAAALQQSSPSAGPTFTVSYQAGPDCPNQATFEGAILARAPRARKLSAGAAQVRFEAQLPAGSEQGRLKVSLADGTSQDREIVADGCAEAMQSMAIIAAMILEAQAAAPLVESSSSAAAAPDAARSAADVTRAPQVVASPGVSAGAPRGDRVAEQAAEKGRGRGWFGSAVSAAIESAAAPSPALGGVVSVEMGRSSASALDPSLRLSAVLAQAPRAETDAGSARFRLLLARAHACPVALDRRRSSLRLCALVEAGALFGRGVDARNERSQTMPWLGAGLGALGALQVAGPFSLELGTGARVLVVRDEFVFAPSATIHQVPDIAWHFSAGFAYRSR